MSDQSELRDGMRIDWDLPITMDDGIVLRADAYRPPDSGRYPVILSYGPYAKGLAFQEGYPHQWQIMTSGHPDVMAGKHSRPEPISQGRLPPSSGTCWSSLPLRPGVLKS